ncbi:UpxY family transcription antiterminator [Sunxiuqinia dokdonensis]|uniref:Transcriptional activator RfaH n=1 Tax=Sunxiuqinia dokdonensis TaxID=1409788 RepID=A0A0L8VD11_9BACT|nr:UpxY family transcription antiterminator [Sunxiuqinia dokdonensis]KOH46067.1 transcriptional activator RfaH [Sunxiuqinia dokdonensis]
MSRRWMMKQGKDEILPGSPYHEGEKKWFIIYLRPRSEKLVHKILTDLNYEVFFPTIRSLRVWKNRQKKRITLPLFPNYLFVYTYEHELYNIKRQPRVATFVSCDGKPATISGQDIAGVKRMLGMDKTITVETRFTKGEPVRIVSGPLAGYEGVLIQQNGRTRFGIRLEAINYTVLIDISRSAVEKR